MSYFAVEIRFAGLGIPGPGDRVDQYPVASLGRRVYDPRVDVSCDIEDRRLLQIELDGLLVHRALQVFRHPDAVFIAKRDVGRDQIGAGLPALGLLTMAVATGFVVGILSPGNRFRRINFESAAALSESARSKSKRHTE